MDSDMPIIVRAVVRGGYVEPLEPLDVADGTEVLVTVPEPGDPDDVLWRLASHSSLARAWITPDDDVYDALAEE